MGDRVNLTTGRVTEFRCPAGKDQAFLRDAKSPWLAVRATAKGAKAFVFEAKLNGRSVREVIGSTSAWTIEAARQAANEKKTLVDRGVDPRGVGLDGNGLPAPVASVSKAARDRRSPKVGDVWPIYLEQGKPRRKEAWKPRYKADLQKAAAPGGELKKRGQGKTKPGPLFSLMGDDLDQVDRDRLRDWYEAERKRGSTQAARALAMFAGFLSWCSTKREYRDFVNRDAAQSSGFQDLLPAKTFRTDALELNQLRAWFKAVEQHPNRTAAAYLVALLLTGARREEMASLKRDDVDTRWDKLTLADKVGTTRTIPLTPYLKMLFDSIPAVRDNPYVFASSGARRRLSDPRSAHAAVLETAGIDHCTTHGLRRSFALFGEAAGAPAGAIAQIMGHRPSAISERYKPRSTDMLRPYLTQIEKFILDTGGVQMPTEADTSKNSAAETVPVRSMAEVFAQGHLSEHRTRQPETSNSAQEKVRPAKPGLSMAEIFAEAAARGARHRGKL